LCKRAIHLATLLLTETHRQLTPDGVDEIQAGGVVAVQMNWKDAFALPLFDCGTRASAARAHSEGPGHRSNIARSTMSRRRRARSGCVRGEQAEGHRMMPARSAASETSSAEASLPN
jgi:hypothetical protein